MYRYIVILIILLLQHGTACNVSNATAPKDTIVYITSTGTKYHAENCRSLRISKIPIPLGDAVEKGYTPCKICHPAVPDEKQ